MAKYRLKVSPIEATQWFKNGDHPQDNCRTITLPNGGESFLSEGYVVRRFRHPKIHGDYICPDCGNKMDDHGWIDSARFPDREESVLTHLEKLANEKAAVCPGDWVANSKDGMFFTIKDAVFKEHYELISFA